MNQHAAPGGGGGGGWADGAMGPAVPFGGRQATEAWTVREVGVFREEVAETWTVMHWWVRFWTLFVFTPRPILLPLSPVRLSRDTLSFPPDPVSARTTVTWVRFCRRSLRVLSAILRIAQHWLSDLGNGQHCCQEGTLDAGIFSTSCTDPSGYCCVLHIGGGWRW